MSSKYFNFPIILLHNYLNNPKKCLNDIFDYSTYAHSLKLSGAKEKRYNDTLEWFEVKAGNKSNSIKNGEILNNSIDDKQSFTSISIDMFFDFYKNYKTDLENVCLLFYLATKSIIGKRQYIKTNNEMVIKRMRGGIVLQPGETDRLSKYDTPYYLLNMRSALRDWNIGYYDYARYCRGFYFTYKITPEILIFEVEKNRKKVKDKKYKDVMRKAREKALKRLSDHNATIV